MRVKMLNEDAKFYKEILGEALWRNAQKLREHFYKHVLMTDETFNPFDPKFAHMTLKEYTERAEGLSEKSAGKSNSDDTVVGWEIDMTKGPQTVSAHFINKPENRRFVKINRSPDSSILPKESLKIGNFYECVIYTNEPGKDNIVTYMLLKPSNYRKMCREILDELPENK